MSLPPERFRVHRQIAEDASLFEYARDEIYQTYGDLVRNKHKALHKYGENTLVGTSEATVMSLPSGVLSETYVADNLITHLSSSDAGDTGVVSVEGHTISGGDLSFVVQNATLTGQTKAALTTPLARCSRIRNTSAADWAGSVYAFEDDTLSGGVPQTAAKVHAIGVQAENTTLKCATSISAQDYWMISHLYATINTKASVSAVLRIRVRQLGGVFVTIFKKGLTSASPLIIPFDPWLIVPPNSDVIVTAEADNTGRAISAGLNGRLAIISS